mmetsp:Transcript_16161/g.18116  ORF Transcript_16161/g.18116 Transcript_16161/m.18116 type:complete len:130 (-) Transcript_16161:76-465(-)
MDDNNNNVEFEVGDRVTVIKGTTFPPDTVLVISHVMPKMVRVEKNPTIRIKKTSVRKVPPVVVDYSQYSGDHRGRDSDSSGSTNGTATSRRTSNSSGEEEDMPDQGVDNPELNAAFENAAIKPRRSTRH